MNTNNKEVECQTTAFALIIVALVVLAGLGSMLSANHPDSIVKYQKSAYELSQERIYAAMKESKSREAMVVLTPEQVQKKEEESRVLVGLGVFLVLALIFSFGAPTGSSGPW